jgi:hypothetical protein
MRAFDVKNQSQSRGCGPRPKKSPHHETVVVVVPLLELQQPGQPTISICFRPMTMASTCSCR